jgi:hypothetical protein
MSTTRVFVASPIYNDQCYGSYTNSLLKLQRALLDAGHDFVFNWTKGGSRISNLRNTLVNLFLQDTSATHLLFVDSDMVFEASDVMKMLDYEHDIMATLYPRKVISWDNAAAMAREHPDMPSSHLPLVAGMFATFDLLPGESHIPLDHPFPIEAAGTGIMLIRRSVFTRMIEAYPELTYPVNDDQMSTFARLDRLTAFFNELTGPSGHLLGEDLSFCQRWRSIGGQIHGCAWFKIRHLGTYEYTCDLSTIKQIKASDAPIQ